MSGAVLIVCTANVCRSPVAQILLANRMPGVAVASAGLRASAGRGADERAVQLMARRGLDLSAHTATPLVQQHVRDAALILTMTREQRATLIGDWPDVHGKVHRLGEAGGFDVIDPYRRDPFIFELAIAQIEQGLADWHSAIDQLCR
ncbi:arsenate reductase/protein-tyrosine-phosphatase family protein [Paraburkholderia solisilvae]|uniref:protein-tyrosine-phosphatase n=1 Tax=Paraburkholderia solisilvae TaxID=624376 RepID=A0A6J5E5A9_9BURK|nr:low molecular weight phosphotyrosine protein phosphatase [Paraburkholderia solisilvae]CAB3760275.1 Low molecular weight protein-tyrosine-phosphatase Ptp [Paraburkholderia solisilvae]